MLSLAPPYYIYDGVPVFADSNDPLQWYYLPNRPHFATDEQGRPAVRFLVLKEDLDQLTPEQEDTAGFLVFDTSLSWPDATLAAVAQKIRTDAKLSDPPRLSPLLFTSGTVRLMFLDQITPDPNDKSGAPGATSTTTTDGSGSDPTGQAPAAPQWVESLESAGVPSLYGENRAIFSATLTKKATQLLYAAFDGFVPAGVIYNLTFAGLQPAFHIHVQADWSQVFNFVKEQHSLNVIFFSSDIEKTVQSLIDNKTIVFTSTIEGVGDEGMASQFDDVRKQLLDFVMNTFFKPTANPFAPDTKIQDGVIGVLTSLRDLGSPIHCGYQRIELDATEVRNLSIDYDIAKAVQRNIAPQAHLEMFFSDYKLTRDQVVTVVDGADSFFKEAPFSVMTSARFDVDGIDAVTVDVAYGQPTPVPDNAPLWSFAFTDNKTVDKKAAWFDPTVGDVAQYRYEVVFDAKVAGPEVKLDSAWMPSRGTVIMVTPDELFTARTVQFQLDQQLPFELFPEVQVELRYTHADTGWTHQDSTMLSQKSMTWSPAFRIHSDWDTTVEYRLTYIHGAGNMVVDWQPTTENGVVITDPRSNLFTVNVIIAGKRDALSDVIVQLRYTDAANSIFESKTMTFNSDTFDKPAQWSFPRADPANDRYVYNAVIVDTEGNTISTGDVDSNDANLLIGPQAALHWTIKPVLTGPSLAAGGVQSLTLDLHYADDDNALVADTSMQLAAIGPGPSWPLQLKDPSKRQYTYTVTYRLNTGFDRVVGPLASTSTFLSISSIPPAS